VKGAEVIFGERPVWLSDTLTLFTLFEYIVYRYGMVSLHCSSMRLVYNLWLFYIVRLHSIFQAEFFAGIFVFLPQILEEFFNI
jgi:hypothetical protein